MEEIIPIISLAAGPAGAVVVLLIVLYGIYKLFIEHMLPVAIIGAVKDVAAKTMDVIITYNQSGSVVLLGQETATITDAPTGGGWGFHIDYRSLILTNPKDHPEGTVSIFMRTNNATATVNDVHFIWES